MLKEQGANCRRNFEKNTAGEESCQKRRNQFILDPEGKVLPWCIWDGPLNRCLISETPGR